jgi:paraquat-inducible protein A
MKIAENKLLLLCLLVIAGSLLVIGLAAPIITFKKFIFIHNTFSILTACWNLLKEQQWFLFILIFIFSVLLPIIKLAILFKLILTKKLIHGNTHKFLKWMHRLGRWSMLDVFVVAILVVVVKLGAIGNVEKHIGLYAYAGAAIMIMLLTSNIVSQLEKQYE